MLRLNIDSFFILIKQNYMARYLKLGQIRFNLVELLLDYTPNSCLILKDYTSQEAEPESQNHLDSS